MNTRVALIALALTTACGGSTINPRPLKYHIQREHLVSVDPAQQQDALAAKSEYDRATLERDKVKSDLDRVDLELLKASNDLKAAALAVDSAKAEDKAAAATADTSRKTSAVAALAAATAKHEVAKAQRDHVAARREALAKQLRWAEFNAYDAEAKFELEKAKVAVNNSIAPSGFKFPDFEAQHKQRMVETAQAKPEVDAAQAKVESTRRVLEEKERALGAHQL